MGPILISIYIFVLAIFVGFGLISKVSPVLYTPLLSALNAISGIVVIGAFVCLRAGHSVTATILGTLAVILATINCVGGFRLTERMLKAFHSAPKTGKEAE